MRFSIIVKQTDNHIVINVLDTGTGIDKICLAFSILFSHENRDYRKVRDLSRDGFSVVSLEVE